MCFGCLDLCFGFGLLLVGSVCFSVFSFGFWGLVGVYVDFFLFGVCFVFVCFLEFVGLVFFLLFVFLLFLGWEGGLSVVEWWLEVFIWELEWVFEVCMVWDYFGICIKCGFGIYGV